MRVNMAWVRRGTREYWSSSVLNLFKLGRQTRFVGIQLQPNMLLYVCVMF